jgi:hypothetical protein
MPLFAKAGSASLSAQRKAEAFFSASRRRSRNCHSALEIKSKIYQSESIEPTLSFFVFIGAKIDNFI